MRKILIGLLAPIVAMSSEIDLIKQKLAEKLPNTKIEDVRKSEIDSLYEVILENGEIIYTDGKYLLFGHIFTFDGQDITESKKGINLNSIISQINKEELLKIGDGEIEVIEITDPECPFCKRAEKFFENTKNTKRYIIFYPLPFHKNARNISIHIMCSKEKENIYKKAMQGVLEEDKLIKCKEGEEMVNKMEEIAKKLRIKGTPTFIIKTQNSYKIIEGADPVIKNYIK